MEFRILGPLQVLDDGRELPLGPAKEQAVLGVLLLHPGSVVSRTQLIDGLWGETPPPTAAKAVNVYVSQVRKTLSQNGVDPIVTQAPGYVLAVDADGLDSTRFQRLARAAHEREGAGEVEAAAALMQEALGLWRGPALAGVELEGEGRDDVARLEELRLAAQLDLIDYELALGRHEQLLAELEPLVAQHPLDERLRGQLILALYRSGRQADALQAYRETRESLVETLGIEPSAPLQRLERAILNHDPSLEAPAGMAHAHPALRRSRLTRGGWHAAVAVASVVLIAVGVGLGVALVLRGGSGRKVIANHAAALDSVSAKVTQVVPVGLRPTATTSLGNRIFVAGGEDNAVLQLNARSGRRVRSIPTGGTVTSLSAAGRSLWAVEFYDREVLRIPIDSVGEAAHIRLPDKGRGFLSTVEHPVAVAATPEGAWISTDRGRLYFARSDGGLRLAATLELPIRAIAYAPPFVWLAVPLVRTVTGSRQAKGEVVRFDLRTQTMESVPVGIDPSALAVVGDGVWVATELDGRVVHVDDTAAIATVVDLHTDSLAEGPCSAGQAVGCPGSLVASDRFLWAPSARNRMIYRVDQLTNRVTRIQTEGEPAGITASADRIWVVAD